MSSDCLALQQHFLPIRKHGMSFGHKKSKYQSCIQRTHFLLALSWVCTVHKVQGLMLDEGLRMKTLVLIYIFNNLLIQAR